jgi:hypothetical protein
MHPRTFDRLVALAATATRRRATGALAGGVLAAAVGALLGPAPAAASARSRCLLLGGVFVKKGTCHCAATCGTGPFGCGRGSAECTCLRTPGGHGFCALGGVFAFTGCARDADCPKGQRCGTFACPAAGGACTTAADCAMTGAACIRGTCAFTTCAPRCGG